MPLRLIFSARLAVDAPHGRSSPLGRSAEGRGRQYSAKRHQSARMRRLDVSEEAPWPVRR